MIERGSHLSRMRNARSQEQRREETVRRPGVSRPTGAKRSILRRAIGLFRPYRAAMVLLLLLISVTAALGLVPALIIREIVDSAIPAGDLGELNLWFGILIAVVVGAALLEVALGYANQGIGQGVMYRLREDLHAHLQRLSVAFYTRTRTGEILSRVSTDVNAVQGAVTGTVTDFLRNAITLAIALGLMFVLEWRLALIALAVVPIFVVPTVSRRRAHAAAHARLARRSGTHDHAPRGDPFRPPVPSTSRRLDGRSTRQSGSAFPIARYVAWRCSG